MQIPSLLALCLPRLVPFPLLLTAHTEAQGTSRALSTVSLSPAPTHSAVIRDFR